MEKPHFPIKVKRFVGDSSIVSLRIPKDMVQEFDAVAAKTGRTRNEIMSMSLEFALEHMDIVGEEAGMESR